MILVICSSNAKVSETLKYVFVSMAKLVEMDDRILIFAQMEENIIIIARFYFILTE